MLHPLHVFSDFRYKYFLLPFLTGALQFYPNAALAPGVHLVACHYSERNFTNFISLTILHQQPLARSGVHCTSSKALKTLVHPGPEIFLWKLLLY